MEKVLHELSGAITVVVTNTAMLNECTKENDPARELVDELLVASSRLYVGMLQLRKL